MFAHTERHLQQSIEQKLSHVAWKIYVAYKLKSCLLDEYTIMILKQCKGHSRKKTYSVFVH